MTIYISSDHAGFELKQHLLGYLKGKKVEIVDKGPFEYTEGDDYPDWISLTAEEVSRDPDHAKGIVIGLSGQGEAITANKFKNIRAAVYYGGDTEVLKLSREHNDANILSLGAKFLTDDQAERAVDIWLETYFSGDDRHRRRIEKIASIERMQSPK